MKTLSYIILLLFGSSMFPQNVYSIPYLLSNNEDKKIYIKDCCVDDTLKIQTRVSVCFENSLSDTQKPIIVKSVYLHDLYIRSNIPDKKTIFLSKVDKINNSFEQYIWDLCYAKVTYWYKHQPYAKWINTQGTEDTNKLYMGATFYIIPLHNE